jgi:uncharacterized Tic20 family protein
MKTLYTILFFAAALLLILLTCYLLRVIDKGIGPWSVALTLAGIASTVAFLVFFLYRYTNAPLSGKHR